MVTTWSGDKLLHSMKRECLSITTLVHITWCFRQFHNGSNSLNRMAVLPTFPSPSHTNTAKCADVHRMLSHIQSTCPPLPHSWDDTHERGTWWLCMTSHPTYHGPPAASNLTGRMVDHTVDDVVNIWFLYAKSKFACGNDTAQWTGIVQKVLNDSLLVRHQTLAVIHIEHSVVHVFGDFSVGLLTQSHTEYSIQMSTSQNFPVNIEWWIVKKHTIVSEGNNLQECLWKLCVIKGWVHPIMYYHCIHSSHPPWMHPSSPIHNLKEGWVHGSKGGILHYTLFININLHRLLIVNMVMVSTRWQRTNQVGNVSGYFG